MGCTAALQAQGIVHSLTLHLVQRERPLTADGDPHDFAWGHGPWARHSYYGGHSANIMACVSYGNERFHMGAAEPVLYTLALGVALGRMADRRHWASDVAVGTLFGHAVGTTVGRRARRRAERGDGADREHGAPARSSMLDRAYLSVGAGRVTVGWRTTF